MIQVLHLLDVRRQVVALRHRVPRADRVYRAGPLPRDDVRAAGPDAAHHPRDAVVRLEFV